METSLPLAVHARLPAWHGGRHVLDSTVDAAGRAHWLLGERPESSGPYNALLVTVDDDGAREVPLFGVDAERPLVDALPDGTFVVADARYLRGISVRSEHQAQIFTERGRPAHGFTLGGELGRVAADQNGDLWVGYLDDTAFADLVGPGGLARFGADGPRQWAYTTAPEGGGHLDYCDVLNVGHGTVWAYSLDFGLLEIRDGAVVHRRGALVLETRGLAVSGDTLVSCGSRGTAPGPSAGARGRGRGVIDRVTLCTLTAGGGDRIGEYGLDRPDGSPLGVRRAVGRGPHLYVQDSRDPADWYVLTL